jgi:hypothetical protein
MTNPWEYSSDDMIKHIKEALATDEHGEALIEVARNAHKAEQELTAWKKQLYETDMSIDELAHWVYKKLNEGKK